MLHVQLNNEQSFELPVDNGVVSAAAFGKSSKLRLYDKALQNTVVAKTTISNESSYRGIPIDVLLQQSSYLETSYLIIYGELPSKNQFEAYKSNILKHTYVHIDLRKQLETFRYNAHPTSMLISLLAATSTLHPESNPALMGEALFKTGPHENKLDSFALSSQKQGVSEGEAIRDFVRDKQVYRMIGKISTLAAAVYRHRLGRPYNEPKPNAETYAENFLYMVDKLNELEFQPDEILISLMDKFFIIMAEDSNACSTAAMRHLISSGVDPYSAVAGSIATLLGESKASNVYYWLRSNVKSTADINKAVEISLKTLPFGFSISKPDVKTQWMENLSEKVYSHLHKKNDENIFELSRKLQASLGSKLFLDLDYWTFVFLYLLGFPSDVFPTIIAIPRVTGLMAHALESIDDTDYKIFRPRQIYTGYELRHYPISKEEAMSIRKRSSALELVKDQDFSNAARRRTAAFDHVLLDDINLQIEETKKTIAEMSNSMSKSSGRSLSFGSIFKKPEPISEEALKKTKSLTEVFLANLEITVSSRRIGLANVKENGIDCGC
eukprot:NODE_355_length_8917_cov_1.682581.p1 type:complete len:553 gc:universal NODE_355_length_8917_cov_1.682581:5553-7211(+)